MAEWRNPLLDTPASKAYLAERDRKALDRIRDQMTADSPSFAALREAIESIDENPTNGEAE